MAQLVGDAFDVGVELIRSLAWFTLETVKAIMSRENFEEMKRFVREAAAGSGNRLSDVTHKLADRVFEGAVATKSFAVRIARIPRLRRT